MVYENNAFTVIMAKTIIIFVNKNVIFLHSFDCFVDPDNSYQFCPVLEGK